VGDDRRQRSALPQGIVAMKCSVGRISLGNAIWEKADSPRMDANFFSVPTMIMSLAYSKNISLTVLEQNLSWVKHPLTTIS